MRRFIISVCFIVLSSFLFSETVTLKDGSVITGEIVSQNTESLTLRSVFGEVEIQKSDIVKIDYQEETEKKTVSEKREPEYERNGAFAVRPLSTVLMGILGCFDLYFEGMTAYNPWFAINCIGDIRVADGYYGVSGCIGPQFNLSRKYLDGFYIGLYPGYQIDLFYGYGSQNLFYLQTEIGYQKVTNGGFMFGFYTGYTISQESQFKFGVKLGGAFPDPLFKIEKKGE